MRACLILAVAALAGCGTAPPPVPPATSAASPVPSAPPAPPATTAVPGRTASTPVSPGTRVSTGWEITVYYTAVERFHTGEPTEVVGCPELECAHGNTRLGAFPADFVQAVKDEGTGRTTAGQYLNWSYDVGFWLDSAPRDTDGDRLTPFVSAAADPNVLPPGTRFGISACGRQDDGSAPPAAICAALRAAAWEITDEFTPGLGGSHHIDAYIGPETGPGFTDSPWYLTLTGAQLTID
ncbi:hypothetical protein ACTOB_005396 [Actinoplanes oblitus]|uniref:Uncharacterized protein n=1 Tax=Actinoplanes oblitus TaxID=3040509 RepID=A0ABY8WAJ6_9ACTN|nr:hypothetical protein [Actinoplanes oblitus]WIM93419.1 hypothetical protein ACTOB_005396 [Actinoplanes oblitus]